MIAIIDYDAGNLKSVEKAFLSLGHEILVTRDSSEIVEAEKIVLPGVGSFGEAMNNLDHLGLVDTIKTAVHKGIPFLGICLGLHLLFEKSEEAPGIEGLSLLEGEILRIPLQEGLKIPHMGSKLFDGIETAPYVYFVHSYYLKAADENIVSASTQYSTYIHASVEKNNLFACQFHPEKSSTVGLKMLSNFADL